MTEQKDQRGDLLSFAWAGLAVALLLLGRWEPSRLFASSLNDLFWTAKIGALLLLLVILVIPRPSKPDRLVPGIAAFLFLTAYLLSSWLWTPVQTIYADRKIIDMIYNMSLVLMIATGLCHATLRKAFWQVFIVSLAIFALIGVVTLPSALAAAADGRLAVLGGGPNIYGRNMALMTVICVYCAANFSSVRILCGGLAGAGLIGVIASGSRGALLAWFVSTVLLVAVDKKCREFVFTRPLLTLGGAAIVAAVLAFSDLSAVSGIADERIFQGSIQNQNLSMRDLLFQWAYGFWLEAPVFGNGLGSFFLVSDASEAEYPHNIFMELLSETGLIGLFLFAVFSLSILYKGLVSNNPEKSLILPIIVLLLVSAQFSGDFIDSRFLFLFMLYPVFVSRKVLRQQNEMSFEKNLRSPVG